MYLAVCDKCGTRAELGSNLQAVPEKWESVLVSTGPIYGSPNVVMLLCPGCAKDIPGLKEGTLTRDLGAELLEVLTNLVESQRR